MPHEYREGPIPRVREFLALWSDQSRSNAEVRAVALGHIGELEAQAARLQEMIATLRHLVAGCTRDKRPDYPIIKELAGGLAPRAPTAPKRIAARRQS